MPAARPNTSTWVVVGIIATAGFSAFTFVWSVVEGQISEMRADFTKAQADARWQYATKDYVNGKIDEINHEEQTYRKYVK